MPNLGKGKHNKKINENRNKFWVFKMFFSTFLISLLFSLISQKIFSASDNLVFPLLVILIIVMIGVIFDIIGIAVTSTSKIPFVSMSAKRIRGAKEAISLIKNADVVSSICNDVVGDVCGIISGAAGTMLIFKVLYLGIDPDLITALISGLIAAMTVGGKALGKRLAITKSQQIIHSVGYILAVFSTKGDKLKKNNEKTDKKEVR